MDHRELLKDLARKLWSHSSVQMGYNTSMASGACNKCTKNQPSHSMDETCVHGHGRNAAGNFGAQLDDKATQTAPTDPSI